MEPLLWTMHWPKSVHISMSHLIPPNPVRYYDHPYFADKETEA